MATADTIIVINNTNRITATTLKHTHTNDDRVTDAMTTDVTSIANAAADADVVPLRHTPRQQLLPI